MRDYCPSLLVALFLVPAGVAWPQIVLDPNPANVLGHAPVTPPEQVSVASYSPNLVEGRELYSPQGVAVDTTGASPILYVADTGNHRVLAWKNATSQALVNLQKPDMIIGQPNGYTTLAGINGTAGSSGLNGPTGLLVDSKGNLYIADSGNNRIIRYPAPFAASGSWYWLI